MVYADIRGGSIGEGASSTVSVTQLQTYAYVQTLNMSFEYV